MDSRPPFRLADLAATLSLATDLGMGQPMEQAMTTCLLSMKAATALALPAAQLVEVYYLALLRFVGCTADSHESAVLVGGDEIGHRAMLAPILMGERPEFMKTVIGNLGKGKDPWTRLRVLAGFMAEGTAGAKQAIAEHCEVAQMLAARLGLPESIGVFVGQVFERWDGKGLPGKLAGAEIPKPVRIVAVARDVDVFNRLGGWQLVRQVLQRRRGRAYDPEVARAFLSEAEKWLAEEAEEPLQERCLEAEPEPKPVLDESGLDEALRAFAEFIDLKSPYTTAHSSGVAELCAEAARIGGFSSDEAADVRRAGLVHDLGKAGIPNGILDEPGKLSLAEWEQVRLHPYLTERILSQSAALSRLAVIAGAHHERLDGSGYHRGTSGAGLPATARLLAAANAYQSLSETRPYRGALESGAREAALLAEVAAGRLDKTCVATVLEAGGHAIRRPRNVWPSSLTDREVEVLGLISRGFTNRAMAEHLTVSPKTIGRHIENIYGKIGVSSRAAATLFAMRHDLLRPA